MSNEPWNQEATPPRERLRETLVIYAGLVAERRLLVAPGTDLAVQFNLARRTGIAAAWRSEKVLADFELDRCSYGDINLMWDAKVLQQSSAARRLIIDWDQQKWERTAADSGMRQRRAGER